MSSWAFALARVGEVCEELAVTGTEGRQTERTVAKCSDDRWQESRDGCKRAICPEVDETPHIDLKRDKLSGSPLHNDGDMYSLSSP